ncbi:MAG: transporter substrate-binding domain-containing protein [Desulfovibrionaceae bacterium]
MTSWNRFFPVRGMLLLLCIVAAQLMGSTHVMADDLKDIKARGEIRHLGIPYANFIIGQGDGLEVEVVKLFARHLGVQYRFVQTNWGTVFSDLTGQRVEPVGDEVKVVGTAPIKGDIIASGLTVLPWRQKVIDFSLPTFPTQVWCIARADFPLKPVQSSGNLDKDIATVKGMLAKRRVMGKSGTCLAPGLYGIDGTIATIINFPGNLNDIAPAIIKGEADIALLDVPDALVALEKWPGKIKVLGPLSPNQEMGAGFRKTSPELRKAFNAFYQKLVASGEYVHLVKKYYPAVFQHYNDFFTSTSN